MRFRELKIIYCSWKYKILIKYTFEPFKTKTARVFNLIKNYFLKQKKNVKTFDYSILVFKWTQSLLFVFMNVNSCMSRAWSLLLGNKSRANKISWFSQPLHLTSAKKGEITSLIIVKTKLNASVELRIQHTEDWKWRI